MGPGSWTLDLRTYLDSPPPPPPLMPACHPVSRIALNAITFSNDIINNTVYHTARYNKAYEKQISATYLGEEFRVVDHMVNRYREIPLKNRTDPMHCEKM